MSVEILKLAACVEKMYLVNIRIFTILRSINDVSESCNFKENTGGSYLLVSKDNFSSQSAAFE